MGNINLSTGSISNSYPRNTFHQIQFHESSICDAGMVAEISRLGKPVKLINLIKTSSENPEPCVTLPRQNAYLHNVNSAFASVASLDFGVFGACLRSYIPYQASATVYAHGGVLNSSDLFFIRDPG